MKRNELVKYLDNFLEKNLFENIDPSLNGLQCGSEDREIDHIAFAVDACNATIEKAIANKADVLVVHHGLFWGQPLAVVGNHAKNIKLMLDNKLDLYAAHLPLDANTEVGHNFTMATLLKLKSLERAFYYKGQALGCIGTMESPKSIEEIAKILDFSNPIILPFSKNPIRKIGIVSGEGAHDVKEAKALGCDLLITGEPRHSEYHWCEEEGISMLCGGHYETEVFGLQSLSSYLMKLFDVAVSFIDEPTGL